MFLLENWGLIASVFRSWLVAIIEPPNIPITFQFDLLSSVRVSQHNRTLSIGSLLLHSMKYLGNTLLQGCPFHIMTVFHSSIENQIGSYQMSSTMAS